MLHIYNALSVALLLCNLIGSGLAADRLIGHYALAKVVGPLTVVTILFCVEHFYGLGSLFFMWPVCTACSVFLIVRRQYRIWQEWPTELTFLLAFTYPLLWRYAFPDIDSSSERMTNLGFIAAYLHGDVLPPTDMWLPPYKLNIYYTFQHYAAALLGRVFGLDAGSSYNLSFCAVASLTITCAYAIVCTLAQSRFARLLALCSFVFGGTGATLLVYKMIDHTPDLWSGMRFIGDTTRLDGVSTDFGKAFVAAAYSTPPANPVKLPMENFAYLMTLGDYHAPLSGLLLMTMGVLCISIRTRMPDNRWTLASLVGSAPLMLAANTWLFPLQSLLIVAYLVFEFYHSRRIDWYVIVGSAALSLLAIFPFLKGFAYQALDFKTSMRLVEPSDRTPWLLDITLHWPLLLMFLIGLINARKNAILAFFTIVFCALQIFTELVFVDDIYSGEFNRFNTTLKWWPYVQGGAILTVGSILLDQRNGWARYATAGVLLALCTYGGQLAYHWTTTAKAHWGRLEGTAWLTDDPNQKAILEFLKVAPHGVVLERLATGAFTYAPALAMFSGHPAMLGWQAHEQLWRGYRADILTLYNETAEFYKGTKADSREWLRQHDVRYVVWLEKDNLEPFSAHAAINAQIGPDYVWKEVHTVDKIRVGLWIRREQLQATAR